jgi:hypothetical protein
MDYIKVRKLVDGNIGVFSRTGTRYLGSVTLLSTDDPVFVAAPDHFQLTHQVLREIALALNVFSNGHSLKVEDQLTDDEYDQHLADRRNPDRFETFLVPLQIEVRRYLTTLVKAIVEEPSLRSDSIILPTVMLHTTEFTASNVNGKIEIKQHASGQLGS